MQRAPLRFGSGRFASVAVDPRAFFVRAQGKRWAVFCDTRPNALAIHDRYADARLLATALARRVSAALYNEHESEPMNASATG